jgi:hypothetical protein
MIRGRQTLILATKRMAARTASCDSLGCKHHR